MADDLEIKIHQFESEAEKREMFFAAFSHELKTPLTSIIGYSDLMRTKELSRERINLCSNYIFTEGKRLETLSMRLLDLIVLKNQEIHCLPTDVNKLIEEVFSVVCSKLKDLTIRLEAESEPAIISLEPVLIKTVFINLIDNARKAIDESGEIRVIAKTYTLLNFMLLLSTTVNRTLWY